MAKVNQHISYPKLKDRNGNVLRIDSLKFTDDLLGYIARRCKLSGAKELFKSLGYNKIHYKFKDAILISLNNFCIIECNTQLHKLIREYQNIVSKREIAQILQLQQRTVSKMLRLGTLKAKFAIVPGYYDRRVIDALLGEEILYDPNGENPLQLFIASKINFNYERFCKDVEMDLLRDLKGWLEGRLPINLTRSQRVTLDRIEDILYKAGYSSYQEWLIRIQAYRTFTRQNRIGRKKVIDNTL